MAHINSGAWPCTEKIFGCPDRLLLYNRYLKNFLFPTANYLKFAIEFRNESLFPARKS